MNALRQKLVAVTDRLAGFEADLLSVHIGLPAVSETGLADPIRPRPNAAESKSRTPG